MPKNHTTTPPLLCEVAEVFYDTIPYPRSKCYSSGTASTDGIRSQNVLFPVQLEGGIRPQMASPIGHPGS